ncbi:hypothetical protein SSABA_v1c08540 [Spiroplasma sabaudiense Ar-1343]|uniref:Transmembrane protein n=1 Tax=Spiroplasma sabaudiense Ar-1343 TaxID=1276257 RepID=W6AAS0_9MOLU|nr:hypothetical protein [Spiroplasma sabaudiense]AHI54253.1 hypothetical protein SSABA_v1c08540 [Spiroplasma sabaudiense Ar-1343]
MELAQKKELREIKKRSISNFESFKKNSKIFVPKWLLTTVLVAVLVNIILLSVILFSNIFNLDAIIKGESSTNEEIAKAREVFVFAIASYLLNCFIDFIFIFYIYRATKKRPIGVIFCFTWLAIWTLFTVGVLFVFQGLLFIRILNLIIGVLVMILIIYLFYLLNVNKRMLMYQREKEKHSL